MRSAASDTDTVGGRARTALLLFVPSDRPTVDAAQLADRRPSTVGPSPSLLPRPPPLPFIRSYFFRFRSKDAWSSAHSFERGNSPACLLGLPRYTLRQRQRCLRNGRYGHGFYGNGYGKRIRKRQRNAGNQVLPKSADAHPNQASSSSSWSPAAAAASCVSSS